VLCVSHHHPSKVVVLSLLASLGWRRATHRTRTLLTHVNLAQIILSILYTLTYTVNHIIKTKNFTFVH
jgi:hypothetical protein